MSTKNEPDPMQRMLSPTTADVLEVSAWIHAFIDGLDQDKEKGWAKAICSAEADPMHNQPATMRYTAEEAMRAIEAYGNHADFPRRKQFWSYIKEERRKSKRKRREGREARNAPQLVAVTDSTRARNKLHARKIWKAIQKGDLKEVSRLADEASQR